MPHPSQIGLAEIRAFQVGKDDLKILFLRFLIPMLVFAVAFNLYLSFIRPEEYYREDAQYGNGEIEDWYFTDGEVDESSPLPAIPFNSVKEGPLSPDEVDRLTNLIRTDTMSSTATSSTSGAGRKRKAGEEDSPVSDASTDGGSSPRTRKLKIETDFGAVGRWVPDYGSCVQDDTDFHGESSWGEYPFSFRVSYPDRIIKSATRRRNSIRKQDPM